MLAEREPETWPVLPLAASCVGVSWAGGPQNAGKYYRARYYDPKIGRFISEDPIHFRGGPNFYAYVQGNPISRVDPMGLQFVPTASDRVTGSFGPRGVRVSVNVQDPFVSEVIATYIHERAHEQADGEGLPIWRDEQLAFQAELGYLNKQIANLQLTARLDCRATERQKAIDELVILGERRSEADAIANYESEARRYALNQTWYGRLYLALGGKP